MPGSKTANTYRPRHELSLVAKTLSKEPWGKPLDADHLDYLRRLVGRLNELLVEVETEAGPSGEQSPDDLTLCRERVRVLSLALKPFADAYDPSFDRIPGDPRVQLMTANTGPRKAVFVTFAAFKAAHEALGG